MGNNPHFDIDVKRGELGESLLKDILEGKVEVKTDYRAKETGNYYVEYKQYNSDYESWSGISITEAKWWAWVCPTSNKVTIVPVETLRKIVKDNWGTFRHTRQPIHNNQTNASMGILVPVASIHQI
jgi:hypothetical protein